MEISKLVTAENNVAVATILAIRSLQAKLAKAKYGRY